MNMYMMGMRVLCPQAFIQNLPYFGKEQKSARRSAVSEFHLAKPIAISSHRYRHPQPNRLHTKLSLAGRFVFDVLDGPILLTPFEGLAWHVVLRVFRISDGRGHDTGRQRSDGDDLREWRG